MYSKITPCNDSWKGIIRVQVWSILPSVGLVMTTDVQFDQCPTLITGLSLFLLGKCQISLSFLISFADMAGIIRARHWVQVSSLYDAQRTLLPLMLFSLSSGMLMPHARTPQLRVVPIFRSI